MDFTLTYGDLFIEKIEDYSDESYYDLKLESLDEFIYKLIKRTLETPLSYIKMYEPTLTDIQELDADYGNPVYRKLSEPLTPTFLSEIRIDIERCLSKIKDTPNLNISKISINSFTFDTISIEVVYSIHNSTTTTQFSFNL